MTNQIIYISYDGLTDPLGQSQVLSYFKRISIPGYKKSLISFEKKKNQHLLDEIKLECNNHYINWIPLKYSKKPFVLGTLWDILKLYLILINEFKINRNTIIHCRSYIPGGVILILSYFLNYQFIFDMRGWYIDENLERNSPLGKVVKRFLPLLRKIEKKIISRSNHVVVLTNSMKRVLLDHYKIDKNKISVIPTCVDEQLFNYSETDRKNLRRKNEIPENASVLIYSGTIGGYYNIDSILEIFNRFPKQSYFIILTKSDLKEIKDKAKEKKLDMRILYFSCELSEVPSYLSAADYGLILYEQTFSSNGRSPTKLAEYLCCGLKILSIGNVGDINNYVVQNITGATFNELNAYEFDNAISSCLKLNTSKLKLRQFGIRNFAISQGVEKYESVYSKLTT